jgi:tetratricopeptide (TPR) repeat protein
VTFSIVSNLVIQIGTIMGERLMYLPSVGFCLALPLAARLALERLRVPPRAAGALLVALLASWVAGNAWRAVLRNGDWRSDATLLLGDLEVNPGSAKIQYNAGFVLFQETRRIEDAERHARRAVEIWPRHVRARAVLAHALVRLGRPEEALEHYREVLRTELQDATVFNNAGFLLLERGEDPERAIRLIERAVELEPGNPHYLDSLGWAYYGIGRLAEARDLVARSLEIDATGESGERRREHLREIERALQPRGG